MITIHGNQYVTVAERVKEFHADDANQKIQVGISTEVIPHPTQVIVKAKVVTSRGTFTGISAANPAKPIEKMSPYEVAETSAVGRALGFAGYGIVEGIATADEVTKAEAGAAEETQDLPKQDRVLCNVCGKNYHNPAFPRCFLCSKEMKKHTTWPPREGVSE
jgi:hypothetical protein